MNACVGKPETYVIYTFCLLSNLQEAPCRHLSITRMAEEQPGFYCSTSGTFFADKDSLTEHYRSDFHKYNLKRKLAGLPPVTKDWFEARRNQLSGTASGGPVHKVWFDPLTKKRFNTENTYQAHVNSKKYKELLKKLGKETPAPVVSIKRPDGPGAANAAPAAEVTRAYSIKAPNGVRDQTHKDVAETAASDKDQDMDEASSGWETASDDGDRAAPGPGGRQAEQAQRPVDGAAASASGQAAEPDEEWEEWDVGRSLFDNHQSDSMEANLEYMFKNFGFYFPDAEYLTDPEGLLKYLGMKLQYGHAPLYTRGDDANSKQFTSLHAVQRHMVDVGRCKMAFEDNEEEYEEFYDWAPLAAELEGGTVALTADPGQAGDSAGYELALPASSNSAGKVLGSRDFIRFYKQRHRPNDTRESVQANAVVARYRALGIATMQSKQPDKEQTRAQKLQKKFARLRLKNELKANVIRDLPRNVTF